MEVYARATRPAPGSRNKIIAETGFVGRLRPTLFYDDGTQWIEMQAPSQTFNVRDYGALGDGRTDDTAAINNAYAAISLFGGALYFPAGTYLVSNLAVWSKPILVYGDGWQTSTIKTTAGTGDVCTVNVAGIKVLDLQFANAVARTAGAYINVTNSASTIILADLFMTGHFIGIDCAATIVRIRDCELRSPTAATGIGIRFTGTGADLHVNGVVMDAAAGSMPAYGILVNGCQDLTIADCDIIHQGTDIGLIPASGFAVTSVYASDTFFDTATNGLIVAPTGTGAVVRCKFNQCWFSSHAAYGAHISAGGTTVVDDIEFTACHWNLNANDGILTDLGPINVRINGGSGGQNGGAGAKFLGTDFAVHNARFGTVGAFAANGTYGVDIAAAACDNFDVSNNDLRGNTTAAYRNLSTGVNWYLGENLPDVSSMHLHGQFLRGDFSNATIASRAAFQTSTLNGNTSLSVVPNGTSHTANLTLYNNSNTAGAMSWAKLQVDATQLLIDSNVFSGGTQLPINLAIAGVPKLTIDVNGNLIFANAFGGSGYSRQVPLTGFAITIANNVTLLFLDPAGALATGTVTLPAAPFDGQEVCITCSQNVTTFTVSPNAGQSVIGAQGFINAVSPLRYAYQASGAKWYRIV